VVDLHVVRVTERRQLAQEVIGLTLEGVDGSLPPWGPGAHVDVVLPSGVVRQYSLCGPLGSERYEIAVLRDLGGRGGSREVHRSLHPGSELNISAPRNRFPLEDAHVYMLIAGGIGITPILSMIEALAERAVPWRLVYGGRSRISMAFLEQLEAWGDKVTVVPQDRRGMVDLQSELHGHQGSAIYVCGPGPMIAAVQGVVDAWDSPNLHYEQFVAPAEASGQAGAGVASGFEVQLAVGGPVLAVSEEQTILQAFLRAGVDVLFSCEEGTCGSCQTTVLSGEVDHRDALLSDEERAGQQMLICVSRARSARLVLDIPAP
jgi:ferredoxin-NADP reductase